MRIVIAFIAALAVAPAIAQQRFEDCRKQFSTGYPPTVLKRKLCEANFMEPINPARRDWYGEHYDKQKFIDCVSKERPGNTGCEIFRLRRRDSPEYWPYEGKVPPIKWPDQPKSIYRTGMTPKEYFEALCRADAGEWIYKVIENVEGVYQIRPRLPTINYETRDSYVMEDPYGHTAWEASRVGTLFVNPPWSSYEFFERPVADDGKRVAYERHSGYRTWHELDGRLREIPMRVERMRAVTARYGYTWRGISREKDRDNGIAGGELIVVDLQTNEVLGLRRGYLYGRITRGPGLVNFDSLTTCSMTSTGKVSYKDVGFIFQFVSKVIKPKPTEK